MTTSVDVYLEEGAKRTFAGALDWPGWCRSGRNEAEAAAALLAYGPRYASILASSGLGFVAPTRLEQLVVVERLPGTASTDFGVPGLAPTVDQDRSCDLATVQRFEKILRAGWQAFDAVVESAQGKTLSTGPRGGGRTLEAIVRHVAEADASYLGAVGWKGFKAADPFESLSTTREAILTALKASAAGEIPPKGPRGGVRWTARYFVRRVAWHVMAHVWEIDRRAGAT
jgi:hypothetical protein